MVLFGVFLGHFQGIYGNIQGIYLCIGEFFGQGYGNASASGAYVQNIEVSTSPSTALRVILLDLTIIQNPLHQFFGLWSGDQDMFVHHQFQIHEMGSAQNILYGFFLFQLGQSFKERLLLFFGHCQIGSQYQNKPFQSQIMLNGVIKKGIHLFHWINLIQFCMKNVFDIL